MPKFYELSPAERMARVAEFSGLSDGDIGVLKAMGGLSMELADRMIENVIGGVTLPLGVAVNFLINGRDYVVPMAIEEPSVVAAASHAAKLARATGGFQASSTRPIMVGQIQLVDVPDQAAAERSIRESSADILSLANAQSGTLAALGGGALRVSVRGLDAVGDKMLVVELHVDCRDAMGANVVNTMCEAVAPLLAKLTGGRPLLRILSNLCTERMARARATFRKDLVGGEGVVRDILAAHAFAAADIYRCATHNKGVMNGIVGVALATGQDTRAIEAACHAYASITGRYRPLTQWSMDEDGNLVGMIEVPLSVGIVGGATRVNPAAQVSLKILGVRSSGELAEVMAAVGLAQNFAALRALVTEGIQAGHMRLHARNIAITAGAPPGLVDVVAERMISEGRINVSRAREILEMLKGSP
jgi:hydroxymethylglutaryl-CoA reductase